MPPTASTAGKLMEIPPPSQVLMTVIILGLPPGLLCDAFSERKKRKLPGAEIPDLPEPKITPEEEFEESKYYMPMDPRSPDAPRILAFPGAAISEALATAAGRFTKHTTKQVFGALRVNADMIPLITNKEPIWHVGRVRTRATGGSRIANRSQIEEWKMQVSLTVTTNFISPQEVLNLFGIAGMSIGIGNYRPELGGPFGAFAVGGHDVTRMRMPETPGAPITLEPKEA